MIKLPQMNFILKKQLKNFSFTYQLLSFWKILKNSQSQSRVMRMRHFWTQNGPFAPNKLFFGKLLISFSSTYQPLSLCKILKKFFQWIQSYEDAQFLPQNGSFPRMRIFSENLLMSFVSFFHSCLSTCQKSKSDINLLVKY